MIGHGDGARPERVLVCVGASPASERLVRAAHRLAAGIHAAWHAVHVDITGAAPLAAEDRDRVEAHLALAEALGGEVARLSGRSVAEAVLAMSRERGITRIIAGKPTHARWRDRLRGSLLDALVRGSGDIEIHVIAPGGDGPPRAAAGPSGGRLASFAPGLVAVAGATALGVAAGARLALPDDAMLYLFAIMIAALGGRGPGIAAAACAVAAYDFFFIPPHFTFAVYDLQNLMTFAVMFTLGTAMGTLVARLRHAETASRQRERRTQTLLAFTAAAARATDVADVAAAVVAHIEDGLAAPAAVLIAAADGTLGPAAGLAPLAPQELDVARSAHAQRRPAGRGTETLPSARLLAVPLWVGSDGSAGAVLVQLDRARRRIDLEGRRLLEAIARQAGGAIARLGLAAEARDAEVRARAEELRSSLLSTVSHDLRTPLAIITGTATALRDEAPALTAAQLESLDTIVDEASRLGKILTNLLAITRVESGAALHRDWVPIEELVGAALDRDAGLAGRDVAIDLVPDIGAEVDPILIEQVLLNLLDNAAKHTPPGTPIELRGFREAGGVALEVSDRGPGLPAGPEDQVFEKFYRGPQARAHAPPAPASASRCAAASSTPTAATIEARRRSGGGATFHLWLPGGDAPAEPRGEPTDGGGALEPRRPRARRDRTRRAMTQPADTVLVVEDEVPMRRFLRSALTTRGFRVVEAGTVREAELAVTESPPEAILLDLGLPDGDGLDLLRRLREWSSAPVIVLSARGREDDKVIALDAGADDYLTKPFGTSELLARIRVALRHARAHAGADDPVIALGPDQDRPGAPRGHGRRPRDPPDADRVPPARAARAQRRQGDDPPPAAPRGLGPAQHPAHPLPAGPHGRAAPQARGRPGAPALADHRARRRLPAARRVAHKSRATATSAA